MSKTYIHNEKEFKTVTIPKGTALFRGLQYDSKDEYKIFSDLIGYKSSTGFDIPRTMYISFYKEPDIPESFNLHVIYLTNYDIELLVQSPLIQEDIDIIFNDFLNIAGYILSDNEIVIHPLHLRRKEHMKIRESFYNSERLVHYCIKNYSRYNYFPLLYINNEEIVPFIQLHYSKFIILNKADCEPIDSLSIKNVVNKSMSPDGYLVNNIRFKIHTDIHTGLYILYYKKDRCSNKTLKIASRTGYGKLRISDYTTGEYYTIPYTYRLFKKNELMSLISMGEYTDLNSIETYLNSKKLSLTYKFILQTKKNNFYKKMFYIDESLDRNDILYTYKRKINTRKNRRVLPLTIYDSYTEYEL